MEKFFAIVGKIVLTLVVLGGAAGAGIYVYRATQKPLLPSPTPSGAPLQSAAGSLPTMPSPSPQPQTKIVKGGLGAESGLAFTKYQLELPQGWNDNHQSENPGTPVDTLTLTSDAYQIKIFQAATGGALCLYPGDPNFEGPNSRYDNFINLLTKDDITLRRSGTTAYSGSKRGFTVCQKSADGSFGQPTGFGHISISTPVDPQPAQLDAIDQILASLKKI